MPEYQFSETHTIEVAASPEQAWRAVRSVTFADVPVFAAFMRVRLAASGRFHVQKPPDDQAILEVATRPGGGFTIVAEAPGREIVLGMVGRPWTSVRPRAVASAEEFHSFAVPGSVRIAMNLRVTPIVGGTRVSTETRIVGTDLAGARAFGRYWRLVYPGSSVLRRAWLDATARRLAETAKPGAWRRD